LSKYDLALIGLLVGLLIVFGGISKNFLSEFNITTLMINFSILFFASLGGTFVIMVGGLDLSYAGVLTIAAVAAALLLPSFGLWALPAAIGLGCVFGLANGILFVKARIPSFLVTLGTLYVANGISAQLTPGGLSIPISGKLDFLLGGIIPGVHTLLIWALGFAAVCYFVSRYTSYGWRIYSTGSSETASTLNGINISRIRVLTFTLSGALAGVTGILLLSYFDAGTQSLGANFIFIPLAAIVVGGTSLAGGVGGPHRTVIGAFLISLILDGLTLSGATPGEVTLFEGIAIILTTIIVSREIKSLVM
jgi:ribose/xylose/arabinose/galactoside ABC-type transport system permease subunit